MKADARHGTRVFCANKDYNTHDGVVCLLRSERAPHRRPHRRYAISRHALTTVTVFRLFYLSLSRSAIRNGIASSCMLCVSACLRACGVRARMRRADGRRARAREHEQFKTDIPLPIIILKRRGGTKRLQSLKGIARNACIVYGAGVLGAFARRD